MKPHDWDSLSDAEKKSEAMQLFRSVRGSFVVGQALRIGAKVLQERGEESNSQDVAMIGEALFPVGWDLEGARNDLMKAGGHVSPSEGDS